MLTFEKLISSWELKNWNCTMITWCERIRSSSEKLVAISPLHTSHDTIKTKEQCEIIIIYVSSLLLMYYWNILYPLCGIRAIYLPVVASNRRAFASAHAVTTYVESQLGSISQTAPLWYPNQRGKNEQMEKKCGR
jgi:hypothetical protein